MAEENFGAWSPEARRLKHCFASGEAEPIGTLISSIENGTASLELVRLCFITALDRIQATSFRDRSEAWAKMIGKHKYPDGIMPIALMYLWSEVDIWLRIVMQDPQATTGIVYFSLAEGRDQILDDWRRVDVPEARFVSKSLGFDQDNEYWRIELSTKLYEGLAFYDGCTNRSVQRLRKLVEWKDKVLERVGTEEHFARRFDLALLEAKIHQILCRGKQSHTDPASYDWFVNHYAQTRRNLSKFGLNVAGLALKHPRRPDAGPFLTWLREWDSGQRYISKEALSSTGKMHSLIRHMMKEASALLSSQEEHGNAKWVAGVYRKVFYTDIDDKTDSAAAVVRGTERKTLKQRSDDVKLVEKVGTAA